ncbi:MAG: Xaa-Pro peptidase family protein [Nanoarchaeota archaeon]|nr:Xaa-Pro peptidase family protein [Nanoarchaeota archaeon]MBU1004373.1 Xaa-Pro peptidase family protein [Nanoarchaeota archaeon]MBU1946740.1 Xaa-Pro peptidase family protein [Nanoarchaeota archaeon]
MPKISEFQAILRKKKIDVFLSLNLGYGNFISDMLYFAGYPGIGAIIIPQNKKPFLVVPEGELSSAKKRSLKVYTSSKKKRLFETIKDIAKKQKIKLKRIGINKSEFTLSTKDVLIKKIGKCRLIDLQKELYRLREQKTQEEINTIKKGCKISDEILKKCFSQFKQFKAESEVLAFLEYETKKRGCEISFPTIVASGIHSSEVHYTTDDSKLKKGFCLIDFGIRYKNYCTDTSRTIYLGNPSETEVNIYNKLLDVQKKAIAIIKPNMKCSKVYKHVKDNLGEHAKFFTHGLGHGVGIMIHELPSFFEDSKNKIKENSVFTIEPGIYLKNYGIRIEDSVLLTMGKVEILTKISKELKIIS